MPTGTGSSGRLMELCPDPHVRLALFCRQPRLPFSDEPPSGPTEIFCSLRSTVSVSLGSPQITTADFRFRMSLLRAPQRSSARFSFHCLRVLGIASDHGRSGDTPQENTDSSATRLGPHANEGTGSSGRLMELCTLTPSRVRLHLFCRQPSRSGDTPQENTDSSATRLGPHANEGTGSSGRLMELCTLTPSRVRLHLFCRQPSDPETPHKKILILLQHVSAPMPTRGPWPGSTVAAVGLHPDTLTRAASSETKKAEVLGRSGGAPHKKMQFFCNTSQPPCQRGDREQWPLDGTLHPDTLRGSPLLQTASRSGDTPQENTDSLQHVSAPMPTRAGSSGRLMELCTLDTLTLRSPSCRQP
ncbi:A Disintegrin And Metalloproteinase With Thrombospondin Motifs 16, partial [Manis pentadactyla]